MKLFFRNLIAGKAIGAQRGFARDFNRVLAILENMEGAGDIEIDKSNPEYWRIRLARKAEGGCSGSFPPSGWSVQKRVTRIRYDSDYHQLQVKYGTVLVKDGTEDQGWTSVITFEAFDA